MIPASGSNLAVFGEIVERYQTIYVTKAIQKSENKDILQLQMNLL